MPEMPWVSWDPNLIPIQEAAELYGRSRRWLDEQVSAGRIRYANVPGDRKLYLLRSELDELLKPHIQRKGDNEKAV